MFLVMPETEGRSLEEIELYFSDNKRKMFDRTIKPAVENISLDPIGQPDEEMPTTVRN